MKSTRSTARVAGQVELERRLGDEQKGWLGVGVADGLAQAGEGMAQVGQRGAGRMLRPEQLGQRLAGVGLRSLSAARKASKARTLADSKPVTGVPSRVTWNGPSRAMESCAIGGTVHRPRHLPSGLRQATVEKKMPGNCSSIIDRTQIFAQSPKNRWVYLDFLARPRQCPPAKALHALSTRLAATLEIVQIMNRGCPPNLYLNISSLLST